MSARACDFHDVIAQAMSRPRPPYLANPGGANHKGLHCPPPMNESPLPSIRPAVRVYSVVSHAILLVRCPTFHRESPRLREGTCQRKKIIFCSFYVIVRSKLPYHQWRRGVKDFYHTGRTKIFSRLGCQWGYHRVWIVCLPIALVDFSCIDLLFVVRYF